VCHFDRNAGLPHMKTEVKKTISKDLTMNYPAASSGVSVGNHLNRPKGRGIKPLSARGGLIRLWRIEG